ncbi:MAG: hypothetical protein WBM83_01885, partial [Flavobacteriaceae bacterium]
MKLFIKNMVGKRSRTEVCALLEKLGLHPVSAKIGEIDITETRLSPAKYGAVKDILKKHDYELV